MISAEQFVGAMAVETDADIAPSHLAVNRPWSDQGCDKDFFQIKNNFFDLLKSDIDVDRVVVWTHTRIGDNLSGIRLLVQPGSRKAGDKRPLPIPRNMIDRAAPAELGDGAGNRARIQPPTQRRSNGNVAAKPQPACVEKNLAKLLRLLVQAGRHFRQVFKRIPPSC